MLFHSFEFIFVFLLIVAGFFHVISKHAPSIYLFSFMVIASLVFYGWWDWNLLWLLIFSVTVNFFFGNILERQKKTWILALGIAFNLGLLGWYKYAMFFSEVVSTVTGADLVLEGIVLPLAISFFTFQQIAFLVDVYTGLISERNFMRYALFVVFFPQLIAGPIVHHGDVEPQFSDRTKFRISLSSLSIGLTIFSIGLFKKVVIADTIAVYPDLVFEQGSLGSEISFVTAWVSSFAFVLQVYFDFSGYSDMAIGLARMFGIVLPQNFNSPLKARSMIDFWQRWHITLTHFLNTYLFNTLMLRETERRIALKLPVTPKAMRQPKVFLRVFAVPAMITMFLIGVWHGAGYQFLIFGLVNGFTLVANHAWRLFTRARKLTVLYDTPWAKAVGLVLTLITVDLTFVIFRADSVALTLTFYESMLGLNGINLPESYAAAFGALAPVMERLGVTFEVAGDANIYPTLNTLLLLVGIYAFVLVLPNTQEFMRKWAPVLHFHKETTPAFILKHFDWKPTVPYGILFSVVFAVSLFFIIRQDGNAFIYFQF